MIARHRLMTLLVLAPALLLLLVFFVVPLARLLSLAFSDPAGPLESFRQVAASAVYRRVMLNTFIVAAAVTLICAILAWPVSYVLTRLKGIWFAVALYGVLFPLWISVLVRTFAWMLLLERNGPINRLIMGLGGEKPLALLFNDTGVLIGMVHVMLPYLVLPLYATMSGIDRRLIQASDGLGAGMFDTFRRIYFPLCIPGLAAGCVFVFLLSLGFFITPALLGGANAITLSMLIANFVTERLAWSLAAAASIFLIAAVGILLLAVARFVPLDRGVFTR
jgi:ABC-type spermidine/putrescine transport system permease subunit I